MENPIEIKDNRRSTQRFNVLLNAQFYFDNHPGYKDCTIIDISRSGASIKISRDENAVKGTIIILEILKGLESINLRGEIVWVTQIENGYLIGIKFGKLIDSNTFKLLG